MASADQVRVIKKMADEKGVDITEREIEELTNAEASELFDDLRYRIPANRGSDNKVDELLASHGVSLDARE